MSTPAGTAARVARPPRPRRSVDTGQGRAALLFLSPWLVGFLLFMVYPVVYSVWLSFTDYDVINDPSFVGTDNYRELVSDPKVAQAFGNTLVFAVMSVPTQLLVALGLALLLERAGRASGFFRTAFFLPKMTPPVAVGVLLLLLLNGQTGLVNGVLGWVGIDGPSWTTDPSWVKPGLALMSLWTVGASVVILLAALANVPRDLYAAAELDGAGWWGRFWHITLPGISGTVYFLVIVDTINALQSFTEAYTAFFGTANSTYANDAALFYSVYLFQQAFEFFHMGYAAAMAVALLGVIAVVTAVQVGVGRRFVHYGSDA